MGVNRGETIFSEVKRTLIGLTVAFLIIALIGVSVFYFFPVFFGSSGPGWTIEKNDLVAIYYLEEELPGINPEKLLDSLTKARKDIVERLKLANPPERVHVYVHQNLNSLRAAITRRKSSPQVSTPLATIDLLHGSRFKPLLVRALTSLSWGQPSSKFLRLGLQGFLTDQVVHPHARTAALKEKVFTLFEVSKLEQAGKLPRTLQEKIYDYFDSPNAPAGINLSLLSSLIRSKGGESPYQKKLEVESVSFVSYLTRKYGVARVRALWKANSLRKGPKEVFGLSLKTLNERWLDFVNNSVGNTPSYSYYRASILFTNGRLKEANELLKGTVPSRVDKEDYLFLEGKINFFRGQWEESSNYLAKLKKMELGNSIKGAVEAYLDLIRLYEEAEKQIRGKVSLFSPTNLDKRTDLVDIVTRKMKKMREVLPNLKDSYNSLKIFIVQGTDQSGLWNKVNVPAWVITGSNPNALSFDISRFVASRLSRTPTYSSLLKLGLINYLARSGVFISARENLSKGIWRPLYSILVGTNGNRAKKTEAGAFVGYLLKKYGVDQFLRIWSLTTPLGGNNSLSSALNQVTGKWLDELGSDLKNFLRSYGP